MPLSLVRVDDRLIHGQVVLGWSRVLQPDRIVVANDRIAAAELERRFYAASVPPGLKVSFQSLEAAALDLLNNMYRSENVLMLFESVQDLADLVAKGVKLDEVNIGGLHYRDGAEEVLSFLFLTEHDRALLRGLVKAGIRLSAQDIPGNEPVIINSLVV